VSAGSDPADRINPHVVTVMAEIDLDVSKEFPKPITDDATRARTGGIDPSLAAS
jgi:arsenate reductase (thioredoxin)